MALIRHAHFVPPLCSHAVSLVKLLTTIAAQFCFLLIACSVYMTNELADIEADFCHSGQTLATFHRRRLLPDRGRHHCSYFSRRSVGGYGNASGKSYHLGADPADHRTGWQAAPCFCSRMVGSVFTRILSTILICSVALAKCFDMISPPPFGLLSVAVRPGRSASG